MRVYVGGSVPRELMDAARIDGAGRAKIFLPRGRPAHGPRSRHGVHAQRREFVEQLLPPLHRHNNAKLNTLTQGWRSG